MAEGVQSANPPAETKGSGQGVRSLLRYATTRQDASSIQTEIQGRFFAFSQGVRIIGQSVFLSSSVGEVLPAPGTPRDRKNATVKLEADGWYLCVQTERLEEDPVHHSSSVVGGDLGAHTFLALSTGESFPGIGALRGHERKLKRLQRNLARKRKFSENWEETRNKIAKLHERITRVRRDFLHKLSTDLSKNHAVVVVEGLRVADMSASARGTADHPGTRVKQKASLNRAILDQGWASLRGCWTTSSPAQGED